MGSFSWRMFVMGRGCEVVKTKREIIVNNTMFFVIIYVERAYSKGHLFWKFY